MSKGKRRKKKKLRAPAWMIGRKPPRQARKKVVYTRSPRPKQGDRKMLISPLVASKMAMWWFLTEGATELNGFGLVKEQDGVLRWTDAFLFTEEGSSGGVTSSPDKMAAIIFAIVEAGQDPADLRLFWHFHTYNVFWSGTDTSAIQTELEWTQGKEVFNAVLVGANLLLRADHGLGDGKEAETLHTEWEVSEDDKTEWDFCRLQAAGKFVSPYEIAGGYDHWGGAPGQYAGVHAGSNRDWAAAYGGYGAQQPQLTTGRRFVGQCDGTFPRDFPPVQCPICGSTNGRTYGGRQGHTVNLVWLCHLCGAEVDTAGGVYADLSGRADGTERKQVIGKHDGGFPPKDCPLCDGTTGYTQHLSGGRTSWFCYSCGAEVDKDGNVYGDPWGDGEEGCYTEYPGVGVPAVDPRTLVDEQGKYVGPWPPARCPACLCEDGELLGQDLNIWTCDKCHCTTGQSGTIYPARYARPVLRPAAQARERKDKVQ